VREALTELGLPPPVETVLAPFSTASQRSGSVGQVAADWFADRKSAPTAVVTSDDSCAEALIAHLGRMGLRVPEDVSVCTLACADTHRHPGLTHCRFDFAAMGRKGVDLLREHCRCPVEPVNRIHRIGFEWVEGGSTRGARE
jgi:DNA-binding LacI/PurR family transcriptional regulator